jgi:deazaflavin-dependent oxidoreductase (nitroreductase family)
MTEKKLAPFANTQYCYVTTAGRVTGKPHEIEIWFSVQDEVLYLLSGGGERSDWVKNMRANPLVRLRIQDQHFEATARFEMGEAEAELARALLDGKYYNLEKGQPHTEWAERAIPVAIEINESP